MKSLNVPYTFPIDNNQFIPNNTLTPTGTTRIVATDPMEVKTYSEMVDMVSKLAYFNRRYVLFFRGQSKEYRLDNRFPTIYPTYFRKYIQGIDIRNLTEFLEYKQVELKEKNHNRKPRFHGALSIMESLHVRWALLQHYEICDTPVIDVTQSLHVAASFALGNKQVEEFRKGVIYVLAFPWPSKNYHNNKEEDIFLARLAGITPPQAKRPYRQEAYAAMSTELEMNQRNNPEEYDFAQRLVCKFEINNSREFWGEKMLPLPESYLVPKDDIFYDFMKTKNDFSQKAR